jgi:hypothetical protein
MNILTALTMSGFWSIVLLILVTLIIWAIFAQINMNKKTYRFFTPKGIDDRILNLTEKDLKQFHPSEQAFVRWYQMEKENGLLEFGLTLKIKDLGQICNLDQVALCAEIMQMINAVTIPDPDLF